MSAEALGAKLLNEVHEESLASLLLDLRAIYAPHTNSLTGLRAIDELLEKYRSPLQHESSPHRQFAEHNLPSDDDFEHGLQDYYDTSSPSRGRIQVIAKKKAVTIDISYAAKGSSALISNLLYHLTGVSVLPPSIGGKESAVVYIDCLNSFSANDLFHVLALQCQETLADPKDEAADITEVEPIRGNPINVTPYYDSIAYATPTLVTEAETKDTAAAARNYRTQNDVPAEDETEISTKKATDMAEEALNHVHVLQCSSSRELLTTLQDLPAYLLNTTAHRSSRRQLGMLIVNGINHFHWQDRFEAELARLESINSNDASTALTPAIASSRSGSLTSQIMRELRNLQDIFECNVIYTTIPTTTTSNTVNTRPRNPDDTSPVLVPAPNENPLTDIYAHNAHLSLRLHQPKLVQFPAQWSLEECLRGREGRAEAVRNVKHWMSASAGGLSSARDGRIGADGDRSGSQGFWLSISKHGGMIFN